MSPEKFKSSNSLNQKPKTNRTGSDSTILICFYGFIATLVLVTLLIASQAIITSKQNTQASLITETPIICDKHCYHNGTCEVVRGNGEISFKCNCPRGFYGKTCKNVMLEEKNLVPFLQHKKKLLRDRSTNSTCNLTCFNGGECERVVVNEQVDYKCNCKLNFHGKQCKDMMLEYDEYEVDHSAKPNGNIAKSEKNDNKISMILLVILVITLMFFLSICTLTILSKRKRMKKFFCRSISKHIIV